MTLSEFKAWLEGYSVSINEAPTPEQWKVILGKLALTYPDRVSGLTWPWIGYEGSANILV